MKNKILAFLIFFALIIASLVYLAFPNKPIFLGQWSAITKGETVKIIGQDIYVTYKKFEQPISTAGIATLGASGFTETNYKIVFIVEGEEVEARSVTNNNSYTLRVLPNIFASSDDSFKLIQVQETEKTCDKLTGSYDHLACYTHLMIQNNDVSYCDKINLEIVPRGNLTCYTSFARYNNDPDLCELIPDNISVADEEKQNCREAIQ